MSVAVSHPMNTAVKLTRVFLVDNQPMMAWALQQLLAGAGDMHLVGHAPAIESALNALDNQAADVVIIGMDYDDGTGFGLIKDLRIRSPRARVVIYSALSTAAYAEHCLRLGARGYVCKSEPIDNLLLCIRQVVAGNVYLDGDRYSAIVSRILDGSRKVESPLEQRLSPGEFEVFHLIGRGLTNQDIAQRLHRSGKTVETYRTRIKEKLGISSGAELAQFAFRYCAGQNNAAPASPATVPTALVTREVTPITCELTPATREVTAESQQSTAPASTTEVVPSEPSTPGLPPAIQRRDSAIDVLVVDDHEVIRKPLCLILSKSGFRPRAAADGVEAIEKVRHKIPEVILLDISMPRMDGIQVLEALKANPQWRSIPVIVMSGMREGDMLMRARAMGAPVILKSQTPVGELTRLIREMATGGATPAGASA